MPYLYLVTNVQVDDPKHLVAELSSLGVKTLKTPETYLSVVYTYNETLSFGGTFEPAYNLQITSLDTFKTPKISVAVSKIFADFIQEKLGIIPTRGYIALNDPGRDRIGFGGSTMAVLMSGRK